MHGFLASPPTPSAVEKTRVYIDVPNSNSQASGLFHIAGWAIDNGSSINAIDLKIDGSFFDIATYGSNRSDVCAAFANQVDCPNVGWSYLLDTTGLSNGTHTLQAVAVSANGTHALATTSFTVANGLAGAANPIQMFLDTPNSTTPTLTGTATISGWSFDPEAPVYSVNVVVDPGPNPYSYDPWYFNVVSGLPRPDVCAAYSNAPNCANSGWTGKLDTTQLSNGPHTVAVTASSIDGYSKTLTASFTVSNNGPLRVYIDQPSTNAGPVSGTIPMTGWAEYDKAKISWLELIVDGSTYGETVWPYSGGPAYFGGYRADVCAVYPASPDCPNVGWSALLDTTQLSNGTHTIAVYAYSDGYWLNSSDYVEGLSLTSAPVTINVENTLSTKTTHVYIDTPTANEVLWNNITVSGWAIDDNTPVQRVEIAVDGKTIGSTGTGETIRRDVCAVYPNRPNCPYVGWNFTFATNYLSNGTHTLTATAVSTVDSEATISTTFNVNNSNGGNSTQVYIDIPNGQTGSLSGQATFAGWAINKNYVISNLTILIDGAPSANAYTAVARPDVCGVYPDAPGCPNVGWSATIDTTLLPNSVHKLDVIANGGWSVYPQLSTASAMFTVANSLSNSPIKTYIDVPGSASISGVSSFLGWAVSATATISDVEVAIDGVPYGAASYGVSRPDVCSAFPNESGCPAGNVGWAFVIDSTLLANGSHALDITVTASDGTHQTISKPFTVSN
ncbi:MAG: hypothetical protein JO061_18590 [Acidobacteriaceae bacterium]|nr:hypothetical protein [Acidobacteriaceae bacterium]